MANDEPAVKRYAIYLCALCIEGKGGICWTPGCALWAKSAPDVPLKPEPHYVIEELGECASERARGFLEARDLIAERADELDERWNGDLPYNALEILAKDIRGLRPYAPTDPEGKS